MTAPNDKGRLPRESFSRVPPVLLPYQQRWIADTSPVKVEEKSRRIGLSWAEAADDALLAAGRNGMDVWYIGYNQEMAQEFIGDVAFWARHFNKAAGQVEQSVLKDEDKDILTYVIRFASGFRVTALSSRPSNLRGKQGKVVIDEAAFHPDLQGLLKAALAMLMWGGRVAIISTHNGDDNPFAELVQDIRAGRKPYSLHRTTLDDALAEGLYQRICLTLGRDWSPEAERAWREDLVRHYGEHADEELFCIPSRGSGQYLPLVLIEAAMVPEIPVLRWECEDGFAYLTEPVRRAEADAWCTENLTVPLALHALDPGHASYFGEDFARVGDLTVILPLRERSDLSLRALCAVELRNVPFRQQEQVLFWIVDKLKGFRGGALDAGGNGAYLAEVAAQRYGADKIFQVQLSERWYLENMPRYKAHFEDRTIQLPKDAGIRDDHRLLRVERGIPKVPDVRTLDPAEAKRPGRRHGDSAVAGALGVFAVRNAPVPTWTYQPMRVRWL